MGLCFSTGEYLPIPSTQAGALEVAGEADSELGKRFPSSGSPPLALNPPPAFLPFSFHFSSARRPEITLHRQNLRIATYRLLTPHDMRRHVRTQADTPAAV